MVSIGRSSIVQYFFTPLVQNSPKCLRVTVRCYVFSSIFLSAWSYSVRGDQSGRSDEIERVLLELCL